MEPSRFDRLTRAVAHPASRRAALAGLLGATLGLLGRSDAGAKKGKGKKGKGKGKGKTTRTPTAPTAPPAPPAPAGCPVGQKPCGGGCIPSNQCCGNGDCGANAPRCCQGSLPGRRLRLCPGQPALRRDLLHRTPGLHAVANRLRLRGRRAGIVLLHLPRGRRLRGGVRVAAAVQLRLRRPQRRRAAAPVPGGRLRPARRCWHSGDAAIRPSGPLNEQRGDRPWTVRTATVCAAT
jgi:hypothetical protein